MTARVPVWLDCDPGHDDASAIILAAHSPALRLLGISTVAGNSSVANTTRNALTVLRTIGCDAQVDVVAGADRPLCRPPRYCPEVHGESGLEGAVLCQPVREALPGKAPVVMYERLVAAGEPVTLIATGALTNVALLFALYPEVRVHVREIVVMGGAIGFGNTHPAAEFNFEIDPEAALMVLQCGVPLTIVPLEVTHTALITPLVQAQLLGTAAAAGAAAASASSSSSSSSSSSAVSVFRRRFVDLMMYFQASYQSLFGFDEPPLHDPCAVAYVIDRTRFHTQCVPTWIVTGTDQLCAGRLLCDLHGVVSKTPGAVGSAWPRASIATKMDVSWFWSLMTDALAAADAVSPLNHANAIDA